MQTLYVIRDWDQHFEVAQSKRSKRPERTQWVPIPNKHDGKSFRRLMKMKNGPALYGAWVLIVQVASKCQVRGTLCDGDGPLTAADIADKTLVDEKIIQAALDACSSKAIGWIESREYYSERAPSAVGADSERAQQLSATGQDRTRQDKTGQIAASGSGDSGNGQPPRQPRQAAFDAATVALPADLDVPRVRDAWREWVEFRRKKRKPISEDAARKQLAELIRYGPDGAVASINASIANDWQGLFEPKSSGPTKQGKFSGVQGFLENHRDAS